VGGWRLAKSRAKDSLLGIHLNLKVEKKGKKKSSGKTGEAETGFENVLQREEESKIKDIVTRPGMKSADRNQLGQGNPRTGREAGPKPSLRGAEQRGGGKGGERVSKRGGGGAHYGNRTVRDETPKQRPVELAVAGGELDSKLGGFRGGRKWGQTTRSVGFGKG